MARAFEAKYGVQVESYRGTSKDLISKFLAEAQAKRYLMDVAESSLPLLMLMQALKLIQPFTNPHIARLIPDAREEAGKGAIYWGTVRESYMGFAYNKNKLPASAVPKNYDDLLKPALKGRMSFVTTDTGSRTVGGMLLTKGEEYLKRLRGQDITMHSVVRPGDERLDHHAARSKRRRRSFATTLWWRRKKKPQWCGCRWISCRPARAAPRCHLQAPHPHAAALFVDFLFSPDGQKILEAYDYGSPAKEYGFKRWYAERV